MLPPTYVTLCSLMRYPDIAAMVAEEKQTDPPEVFPVFAQDDGDIVVLFRGDAGYDSGDGSAPGARHRALLKDERWVYVHKGVDEDYPAFIKH